jgi:uncharacterized protein YegL
VNFDEEVALAENPEPRCPCVLLLDVSASMLGSPIALLSAGLRRFAAELAADSMAAKRVEVAVITFGETVSGGSAFAPVHALAIPPLKARGETPMGAAIEAAIDLLRARKDEYRRNGISFFRPWIFLLTDGAPTDDWRAAAQRVAEGERTKAFSFFAVAVPPADVRVLGKISVRPPLQLHALRFADLFVWLSNSLRSVSASQTGREVALEDPTRRGQWATDGGEKGERADVTEVAIVTARCSRRGDPFLVRVEQLEWSQWEATYTESTEGDAESASSSKRIPGFGFSSEYAGCPSCRNKHMFLCQCGGLGCSNEQSTAATCPWCGLKAKLVRREVTVGTLSA